MISYPLAVIRARTEPPRSTISPSRSPGVPLEAPPEPSPRGAGVLGAACRPGHSPSDAEPAVRLRGSCPAVGLESSEDSFSLA